MGKVVGSISFTAGDFEKGFELTCAKRIDHYIAHFMRMYNRVNSAAFADKLKNFLMRGYTMRVMPGNDFTLKITERVAGATAIVSFNPTIDVDLDAPLWKKRWRNEYQVGNVSEDDFFAEGILRLFRPLIKSFVVDGQFKYHVNNKRTVYLVGDTHLPIFSITG